MVSFFPSMLACLLIMSLVQAFFFNQWYLHKRLFHSRFPNILDLPPFCLFFQDVPSVIDTEAVIVGTLTSLPPLEAGKLLSDNTKARPQE